MCHPKMSQISNAKLQPRTMQISNIITATVYKPLNEIIIIHVSIYKIVDVAAPKVSIFKLKIIDTVFGIYI